MVVVLGLFLLVVWASTGRKEVEEELDTPPLPAKLAMPERRKEKEFLDFDYKYDKKKVVQEEVRNVKEEVARVVQQARDTNSLIREQLLVGDSMGEKPVKDLTSKKEEAEVAKVAKVVTRRRQDTLNGIPLPAQPQGESRGNPWVYGSGFS